MAYSKPKKQDVYQIVNDRILESLEKGVVPWRKPWKGGDKPTNLKTKKPYRGINVFMLMMAPYASPYWLTFKQAKGMKGSVKKGEKGTPVVFWNWHEKTEIDENGDKQKNRFPFLRYYTVFNVEQCEGIEIPKLEDNDIREHSPIESAERIVDGMPKRPEIKHEAQSAFYNPALDYVNLPKPETFESSEAYYSTTFHELAHSTGHKSRLDRKLSTSYHKKSYSKEELIAEMTAAYLCTESGIENATIENSAAYIDSWRKRIAGDKKLVIQAAGKAQKASDYILNRKPTKDEKEE